MQRSNEQTTEEKKKKKKCANTSDEVSSVHCVYVSVICGEELALLT